MVVFTCDSCGESVKKAQVETHVLKCRSCQVLSCIDCGKDFWGDDYKNHIKCISEDQKYGGKHFQPKENKGDVKQQQWIQRIQQAMERPDIEPGVWKVLQMVSTHSNVPRKRAKFENWMKNCLKIRTQPLMEKVWEICSSAADGNGHQTNHQTSEDRTDLNDGTETNKNEREERKNKNKKKRETSDENSEEQNGENTDEKQTRKKRKREEKEQNGQNKDEKSSKKQKKRKQEAFDGKDRISRTDAVSAFDRLFTSCVFDQSESLNPEGEEPENQESESNSTGKFNWKGTIKAVLRDAPEDGIAVKKLRKKVLAAYYSFSGDSNFRSEEELLSLFNRKLNKNPKFRVLKDRVRLVK
ncbi:cell growth-regulating nucleolar [Labeo rohita]|nr:cell growth-regulating nucleolar [Labeo rohita]